MLPQSPMNQGKYFHPCHPLQNARTRDAASVINRLFELLLGAELVGVTALALAAVGRTGRETSLGGVR